MHMLQINHFVPIQLAKKNKNNKKRHSLGRHVLWVGPWEALWCLLLVQVTALLRYHLTHMLTKRVRMLVTASRVLAQITAAARSH